jgi:transposase
VASGKIANTSCGPTRNEADFASHVLGTVATEPDVRRWHFVVDNLDTHRSETLVRLVARASGLEEIELGEKGKHGILHNRQTRAAFLSDPTHKIVFHYTPLHSSWLNQIEIWLSILVRKLLRRGSFRSVEELEAKVLQFIEYYNKTMAKPFAWTYRGKALVA